MERTLGALVSVVTPVYNGESFLSECIESVIGQSYGNWEYVIVNNASTDSSGDIAEQYAKKDARIRVIHNTHTLSALDNSNYSLQQISPDSKYCKVLHADDLMYTDCLARMVASAEQHPSAGIVGSYYLRGTRVDPAGLEQGTSLLSGREVGRARLKGESYLFGSPSSLLILSEIVRSQDPFYNIDYIHSDIDACMRILIDHDFAFVPQLLTFTRLHEESRTSREARPAGTDALDILRTVVDYGPKYFDAADYDTLLAGQLKLYYRSLARNILRLRVHTVRNFHKQGLASMGMALSPARVVYSLLAELIQKPFGFLYTQWQKESQKIWSG